MHHHAIPTAPSSPLCRRLLTVTLALLVATGGCKQKQEATGQQEGDSARRTTTICHGSVTNILPRIALEQGYFAAEGLTVTVKDMSDGKLAFDGLLTGECTFAVNGSPPIALHDPQQANFAILATVMSDDDAAKIITRRDHGITAPQDIKGKRIGVKQGIIGHLFLDLFMMKHGLKQSEVTQVAMDTDAFQPALAKGEIDGFAMTNKMVRSAAKTLGEKAVVFAEPGLNVIYGILTTRTDLPQGPQAAPQVLRALVRAERFAKDEPAAAKALLAKAYNFPEQELNDIWARTTIEVALNNTIFVNLEDQYKWQVERGFFQAFATPPNYLAIVAPTYLRATKPEAVSVVKQ
jgi:NitT/TauT family transport system substrate-binding protein